MQPSAASVMSLVPFLLASAATTTQQCTFSHQIDAMLLGSAFMHGKMSFLYEASVAV